MLEKSAPLALRACPQTIPALVDPNAPGGVNPDLRLGADALRVAAPLAMQRTPFEKHLCPDPGPVVNSKVLNVKDHPLRATGL